MQERLTIQDIARLAGVSKASVSRVLNRHPSVSAELHERVMRIVQEYQFIPNATATGLAGGKTRLIGVLTPPLTWPAIPEMLRGVAEYIEQTSYEIVLYSINFDGSNHAAVLDRILPTRMVSGLLAILPGELSPHLITRFQQGLPLVMINDQEQPTRFPFAWVGIDNHAGAYQATRHLLDLGHRRIAHVRGPQHYYCAIERYQGYCHALQDAGITPDPSLLFQGNFDPASGRQSARMLFARNKSAWPEAIFAGNDQMAYGILEVAEEQGVQIPRDVALVGFDDNVLSAHTRPPLTTIHQPFSLMGHKAIELLLTMIDPDHLLAKGQQKEYSSSEPGVSLQNVQKDQHIHLQLPTNLILRASSSPARSLPMLP